MAWSSPRTWVAGEQVTASIMNAHVRDNLTALAAIPATTLPGSPVDGQHATLTDSTAAPTYAWNFVYSATASKWIYLGGSSGYAKVDTSESTASTSYVDLTTAGPSFTVPKAGVYLIEFGSTMFPITGGPAGDLFTSPKIGSASASDTDAIEARIGVPVGGAYNIVASGSRNRQFTCAASDVIKLQYRVTSGTASSFSNRWLTVTPVTVT